MLQISMLSMHHSSWTYGLSLTQPHMLNYVEESGREEKYVRRLPAGYERAMSELYLAVSMNSGPMSCPGGPCKKTLRVSVTGPFSSRRPCWYLAEFWKLQSPAPRNYPLRDRKYHRTETIRPSIELHWGV